MNEKNEPEEPITVFFCGPRGCEHVWDGPGISGTTESGGGFESATCSKCGMDAMTDSLWNGP